MKQRKSAESSGIDRAAELVREANARVNETAQRRDSREGVERWNAALFDLDQAMRQLYPPTFEQDIERLRDGDPISIETAIRFLEADPWAFGTGYAKEEILGRLRRVGLTSKQRTRLCAVILRQVDQHDRREFRRYCLLAPIVADDAFRQDLFARLRAPASGPARRALWVLDAIGESLEPGDHAIARDVIEALAATSHAWKATDWLRMAIRRHGDAGWFDDLITRAAERGKAGQAALLLAGLARSHFTPEQRARLDALAAKAAWEH